MNTSHPHPDTRTIADILSAARTFGALATEEDTSAALARLATLAREEAALAPRGWATPARFAQLSLATLAALLGNMADQPEPVAVAYLPHMADLRALAESWGADVYLRICESACAVLESARDDEAIRAGIESGKSEPTVYLGSFSQYAKPEDS